MSSVYYHCVIAVGRDVSRRLLVVCTIRYKSTNAVWTHKASTSQRRYGGEYGAYECFKPAYECPRFNSELPMRSSYRQDIPG